MLTLEQIKKIVLPIAKGYRIKNMYLFGSYAKGSATENSDLDFRFDRPDGMSLFKIGGLQYELSEAFGAPVDVVTTSQLSEEFRNEIQGYEVQIYGER